jgi:glycosyltransferase involved in cell wall biosynthesis
MYRVAVVASHPIQYQAPWFRALAHVVDLDVFFCHRQDAQGQADAGFGVPFAWDVPLLDGYRHHWLTNVSAAPDVSTFGGCDTPEIASRLRDGGYDACIVNGWYLKSYVQAIRACWRAGIHVLVRGDSHLKTPRSRAKAAIKYLPYRWFLKRIDAHLYVGAANRAYLRSYGVPADRLFFAPHFVDNAFFGAGAQRARADGTAARLRAEWGVGAGERVMLFAGKFIEKKRPQDFIDAIADRHRQQPGSIRGVLVGGGPLRTSLEAQAAAMSAPVHFAGFKNQSELPACYSAADALVLPSDGGETWGLVVNEALACGVPAIVSDQVGCADDLIRTGETGFVFPCGDVAQLSDRMSAIVDLLGADESRLRNAARVRVQAYTADAAAVAVLQALDVTVGPSEVACRTL